MGEIVCVAELREEHSLSNITRHKEVCDPATGGLHPRLISNPGAWFKLRSPQ